MVLPGDAPLDAALPFPTLRRAAVVDVMRPHSLPRRIAGGVTVLVFVLGLYQYVYGVVLA